MSAGRRAPPAIRAGSHRSHLSRGRFRMRSLPRRCAVAALVAVVIVLTVARPATADAPHRTDPVASLSRSRQRALADELVRLAIGGQDRVDARAGGHDLAIGLGREPTTTDVRDLATRVASRRVTAVFGDHFRVDDAQAPGVRKAVISTLAIPDVTFGHIAAAGLSVWVGAGDITRAPGGEELNDFQPAVDSERSWSTIPGVYIMGDKRILVDAVDDQGTRWTLLHEFGHAVDFALGLSRS